ncbi:MAG TPA: hypothetical protein VGE12_22970 [Noviherbaspirillum sp.]
MRWIPGAGASLLALHAALPAHAVELGDIRIHSWLGRQLKASIPLGGDDARDSAARCFKGVLVNLHGEPVSALRVSLQHTTGGSLLLLFGGSAIDEPAATVVVENLCGTGGNREYPVLLDLVPETPAAVAREPQVAVLPQEVGNEEAPPTRTAQVAAEVDSARMRVPDTIYPIPGMPSMRLAAMLGDPAMGNGRRAAAAAPATDGAAAARLRLETALAAFARTDAGSEGAGRIVPIFIAVTALLAAAGWVVMRLRAMRAAARPWLPIDERIDAGADAIATKS